MSRPVLTAARLDEDGHLVRLDGECGQRRHLPDLRRVERFGLQQGVGEGVQLVAVRGQQPVGFAVALLDDAPDLGVDQL